MGLGTQMNLQDIIQKKQQEIASLKGQGDQIVAQQRQIQQQAQQQLQELQQALEQIGARVIHLQGGIAALEELLKQGIAEDLGPEEEIENADQSPLQLVKGGIWQDEPA